MITSVSVIIPIYKEDPEIFEKASFKQCLKVLAKHDIHIIHPKGIDLSKYLKIASLLKKKVTTESFRKDYFLGIEGYNRLMLSTRFYNRFKKYEYILIYQLDAWVFSDQLDYWCAQGYDYIGAPVFADGRQCNRNSKFTGALNGGFTLRKTRNIIKTIHIANYIDLIEKCFFDKSRLVKFFTLIKLLVNFTKRNITLNDQGNEDTVFCLRTQRKIREFRIMKKSQILKMLLKNKYILLNIPELETSAEFAFEENLTYLYELNNYHLPFGTHAWQMEHNINFWSNHISYES